MTAALWLALLAKAVATASIVIAAATAAEALGPVWGAIIACLPVSAGPAYVFLALQHGADFVAVGALNSAAANAATGLFLITYAGLARRLAPWRSLPAAVAVWLLSSLIIRQVAWTLAAAAMLNFIVYAAGLALTHRGGTAPRRPAQPLRRRWFDLPLRATAVAVLVALVVAGSTALGPAATGIAAVFPVSLISLIAILQRRLGGPAAARVAANALPPMLGFGVMLMVIYLVSQPLGVTASLSLALMVSLLWSGALLLLQARSRYG